MLEILPEYVLHWIVKRGNERCLNERDALLTDKLVNKVLAYSFENLAPGGRVIPGNFHARNPAKEFMDYVLEWNLIHRTEADMNRLFERSVFCKPCSKIQFEALGIDFFAECSRD